MVGKFKSKLFNVYHPPHYKAHPSGVECIQITEHMSFCLGTVSYTHLRAHET